VKVFSPFRALFFGKLSIRRTTRGVSDEALRACGFSRGKIYFAARHRGKTLDGTCRLRARFPRSMPERKSSSGW